MSPVQNGMNIFNNLSTGHHKSISKSYGQWVEMAENLFLVELLGLII